MPTSAQPPLKAHVIHSDAEAIAVAHKLAARFAVEASIRDRDRRLPINELDEFSASGLWGITVPKAYGGAGVSYGTVAEVIKIISAADSSLGQIPQSHLGVLDILLQSATEEPYALTHETFIDAVELLVPELQKRGVYMNRRQHKTCGSGLAREEAGTFKMYAA